MRIEAQRAAPAVIDGQYSDFDEFADATAEWEVAFNPLARSGPLRAGLFQWLDPDLGVGMAAFSQPCLQAGAAPRGRVTIGLLDDSETPTHYCGRNWTQNRFALIGHENGFQSTSHQDFRIFTLTFSESLLWQAAEQAGCHVSLHGLGGISTLKDACPVGTRRLRNRIKGLIRRMERPELPLMTREEKLFVATQWLALNDPEKMSNWRADALTAESVTSRARALVHERLGDAIRVRDIAQALSLSVRTLELAFRKNLGVTPGAYIRATRMQAFHRALLSAPPGSRVSDIAAEYGYWHMGQLARDYQRFYGRLPSQTLRRSGT